MAAGQVGPSGVAAQTVFAAAINASEHERAPTHYQVAMELIVWVKTLSKWTARLMEAIRNGVNGHSVKIRAGDP